jgi:hypothetical protein
MKRIVVKAFLDISPKDIVFAEELGYDSHIDYDNKTVVLAMED